MAFLLNIMLTAIASICFYVSLTHPVFTISKMAAAAFALGVACVGLAYWGHVTANSAWKMLITKGEVNDLRALYSSSFLGGSAAPSPLPKGTQRPEDV